MDPDWNDAELLQHVFDETTVLRKPLRGIIAGYHVLPYILVGTDHAAPARSVEVRGRIKVSPRLVIAPGRDGPTYGDLFGETELMDQRIGDRARACAARPRSRPPRAGRCRSTRSPDDARGRARVRVARCRRRRHDVLRARGARATLRERPRGLRR